MKAPPCPVVSDAQRAAGKPWASLIFWSVVFHLVFLTCFLTVAVTTWSDFDPRILWIAFASSWLIQRGITDYSLYQLGQIVESPQRSPWSERLHRLTMAIMLVILIATISSYWW